MEEGGEAWRQGYDVLSFKRHRSVQASTVIVTLKLVSKVKGGSTVHEHVKTILSIFHSDNELENRCTKMVVLSFK